MSALGCDVGGTAVKMVRLRPGGIAAESEIPSRRRVRPAIWTRDLVAALRELESDDGTGARGPLPLGVALPGFLDERRRKVLRLAHLPLLDGLALATRLEKALGGRVTLETDTNAGAVAEATLGAGRGIERVLYVTLGTGLGAALTVEGRPVRVSHHTVGQVAHVPLEAKGLPCPCGQRGCAEALLSARGIVRRAGLSHRASPRELFEAADAGDRHAVGEWKETGELLGRLLRILAGLFQPRRIIVGGGIAAAARHFLPATRAHLRRTLPRDLKGRVDVEPSELGRKAGAVGAALIAAEQAGTG